MLWKKDLTSTGGVKGCALHTRSCLGEHTRNLHCSAQQDGVERHNSGSAPSQKNIARAYQTKLHKPSKEGIAEEIPDDDENRRKDSCALVIDNHLPSDHYTKIHHAWNKNENLSTKALTMGAGCSSTQQADVSNFQ